MTFRVIGANDRRTLIEIELPFTDAGDWAYDEDGDLIKGRVPVTITLPRFDCLPIESITDMQKIIRDIEKDTSKTSQDANRAVALAMIRPHVSDAVFDLLSERTLFELTQISEEWTRRSTLSPGELPASANSSSNTRRRSTTSLSV